MPVGRPTYGGQAVIEGVMIRGPRAMAIAVRQPDGTIVLRSEPLGGIYSAAVRRVPLVRGVAVLWETLALGMRALAWSAAVAAGTPGDAAEARTLGLVTWLTMAASMAFGVAVFFLLPVLGTAWLEAYLPGLAVVALEGVIRIALLVGYVWAIARSEEIARVFQYHGAEHMTIHAFEQGQEPTVPAVRRFAKEHPRCGTSFLLTVGVVAVLVFALLGSPPLWWRLASRVVLIPLIAAVAYEAIRFAGFHQRWPVVRWLFAGNMALQKLTTRAPDDEQIQVAIAALDRAIAEERGAAAGPA